MTKRFTFSRGQLGAMGKETKQMNPPASPASGGWTQTCGSVFWRVSSGSEPKVSSAVTHSLTHPCLAFLTSLFHFPIPPTCSRGHLPNKPYPGPYFMLEHRTVLKKVAPVPLVLTVVAAGRPGSRENQMRNPPSLGLFV